MRLNVNPNRMELLRLRKRLQIARRGHKLLKDKQEELMRQFMELVKVTKSLRQEVEKQLLQAHRAFLSARMDMQENLLTSALAFSQNKPQLEVSYTPIMNLRVPKFHLHMEKLSFSHGFAHASGDLDWTLTILKKLLPTMIELAEREKAMHLIADELEKTRRRVNALEYILIPGIEETIKFIVDKLSEMERANLTRLMKVKDIVRSH